MPSLKNITWERLEREGAVTYPSDAEDKPGNEIMFAAGFPTASGRGKLVPTNIVPPRSEEHTSELQSIMRNSYAVFCLKKKKIDINKNKYTRTRQGQDTY